MGELLAAVEGSSEALVVLAVTSSGSGFPGDESSMFEVLARKVAATGRPIAFMQASGDPALAVLDFARRARASRVLVLRSEESREEEVRQRCLTVWRRLPSPRGALVVEVVAADTSLLRIELDRVEPS
jgi:hypothetical protein